ncbi:hypothetical protein EX30DRAFT_398074 [Ascodesmis nigricans]|uniref:Kinetochore protein Sos7 coiled-coil domain-containing protein n=1 Tax=Ascodesmis nigricans TaxID=341454 RepID=A0A4S2MLP8_9PEZI|nr:hypothetical protein EX30DRAFT_398074 [Ascodesmis nigricans]
MSTPIQIFDEILKHKLTLDKLTTSITAPTPHRTSDASDTSTSLPSNPDPTALATTLENYKEYFSKLRFNYLEQMTKEKFLHMIVVDPPVQVEATDNERLEEVLRVAKMELGERKEVVQGVLKELERVSRRIAPVYDEVTGQIKTASSLPGETEKLELENAKLADEEQYGSDYALPLDDTQRLYMDIESELLTLEKRLEELITQLPKKQEELEQLTKEIRVNEASKAGLEKFAEDAVKLREGAKAAGKVERENAGQW